MLEAVIVEAGVVDDVEGLLSDEGGNILVALFRSGGDVELVVVAEKRLFACEEVAGEVESWGAEVGG